MISKIGPNNKFSTSTMKPRCSNNIENFDSAGEEEQNIDNALKQCANLKNILLISFIQVKLLNRKYCQTNYDLENIFNKTVTCIPYNRKSSSEIQLRTNRNTLTADIRRSSISLRYSLSSPDFLSPTMRLFRPLQSMLWQSNEITVQVIKIRRNFEGIMLRVEFLVRHYCKTDIGKSSRRRRSLIDIPMAGQSVVVGYHDSCNAATIRGNESVGRCTGIHVKTRTIEK